MTFGLSPAGSGRGVTAWAMPSRGTGSGRDIAQATNAEKSVVVMTLESMNATTRTILSDLFISRLLVVGGLLGHHCSWGGRTQCVVAAHLAQATHHLRGAGA